MQQSVTALRTLDNFAPSRDSGSSAVLHCTTLPPCSLSVVSVGGRVRDWGIGDRNFILENSSKAARTRANGGTEKGPPKNVAEAWCYAVCVANTLINHNNGLPGKNLVTVASHTADGFALLIQSSEVACFMHPSVRENR